MAIIYKVKLLDLTLESVIPVSNVIEIPGIVSIKNLHELHRSDINNLKHTYPHFDMYHDMHSAVLSDIHFH